MDAGRICLRCVLLSNKIIQWKVSQDDYDREFWWAKGLSLRREIVVEM
jgi:hypothetical protein